jgi:hypothetical protein
VDAAVVVVVDVGAQVALQPCEADVQVAGEGGPPAFLEDEPVERFDGTVGLGAAGADLPIEVREASPGRKPAYARTETSVASRRRSLHTRNALIVSTLPGEAG